MSAVQRVAIFWDYENCALPANSPGAVVNNIRELAHDYGSVITFNAYAAYSELPSSLKSLNLRSELQSCGVSLIDCPHNGRKDVADKMMIVDMLTWAIDTPAPATVVLISGDRDFAYAVSVLRLRRYRVLVLAPGNAHASIKAQATEVFQWPADIMPSGIAGKPRRASTSSLPVADSPAVVETSPARPKRASSASVSSMPSEPTETSTVPAPAPAPAFTLEAWKAAKRPAAPPVLPPPSPSPSPSPLRRAEVAADPSSSGPSGLSLAAWKARQGVASIGVLGIGSPRPKPPSSPVISDDAQSESISADSESDSDHNESAEGDSPRRSPDPSLPCPVRPSSASPAVPGSGSSASSVSSGMSDWETLFWAPASLRPATISAPSKAATPSPPPAASLPQYAPFGPDTGTEWYRPDAASPKPKPKPTPTPAPTPASTSTGAFVPAEFRPLVRVLRAQQRAGVSRVPFSQLGALLLQEAAQVYERAGVARLKEYTALAEDAGLVVHGVDFRAPGGLDGNRYVSLHRAYCAPVDAVPLLPVPA